MLYKALVSFCGVVSMSKGEIREISDSSIVNDLIKAGYIEEVKAEEVKAKPKKRRVKKDEY